ncbi:MAG: class II aldolase/adducin family protein [Candidatus Thorarchaeota archaeon]
MYEVEKKELLDICLEMIERSMVIGSSGNASVRVGDHVVITPSSVKYKEMKPEDMMVIDLEGDTVEGDRNPSVESLMHLEAYRNREDAAAVIHPHSIYTTALSILHKPLPMVIDEVVPKLGGEIRVASYSMPGSKDLAKNAIEAMEDRSVVLLANHGALCIGKNLRKALDNAILLERTCQIYLIALQAGQPIELPADVVEEEADLWEMMRDF